MVLRYRFLLFQQHRSFHPSYNSYFNTLHVQTGRDIDVMPFWPMRPNFCSRQSRLHVTVLLHFSLFSACHGLYLLFLCFEVDCYITLTISYAFKVYVALRQHISYASEGILPRQLPRRRKLLSSDQVLTHYHFFIPFNILILIVKAQPTVGYYLGLVLYTLLCLASLLIYHPSRT